VPNYDRWIASHRNDVDLPYVLNSRCWARALSGSDLDKALADCNEALDAKPDQAHFRDSRGLVYLRQEKLKNAVADYDEALKSNPKLAWAMFGRGLAYLRLGESDRGKADIAAARQLRPSIEAEAKAYGLAAP
jgi:tetratricopeptide (TPR) repeat protein